MLEIFYENIGGKIKKLAQWSFVIGAIGEILTGLGILMAMGLKHGWWGLIIIIVGPVLFLISSWSMYGIGELIEKTCDNENNTRQILAKLNKNTADKAAEGKEKGFFVGGKEGQTGRSGFSKTENGTIICSRCHYEQPNNRKRCWHCDAEFISDDKAGEGTHGKKCELCDKQSDQLTYCKIIDDMGTRYRNICDECIQKHNAKPQ